MSDTPPPSTPPLVIPSGRNVLLDFTATWCGPCTSMHPVWRGIPIEGQPAPVPHGKEYDPDEVALVPLGEGAEPISAFVHVDIDVHTALADEYQIRGVPTLVYLRDGKEIARAIGCRDEGAIGEWLTNPGEQLLA